MAQRKKAKRAHEKNQPHEAIAMLRADHQRVRDLFQAYQAATDPHTKREIAEAAFVELETHAQLEKQIFYPTVNEETEEGPALVKDALEDHQTVTQLIHALRDTRDVQAFDATFTALVRHVEHHMEEEEAAMLPLAEEELEGDLDQLTEEMQALKQELMAAS